MIVSHRCVTISVGKVAHVSGVQIYPSQISSIEQWFAQQGTVQYSVGQVDLDKRSFDQVSSTQIGFTQVSSIQDTFSQVGSAQIGSTQVSSFQDTFSQVGSAQVGSAEVSVVEFSTEKVTSTEIGTAQINFAKSGADKFDSTQVNPSKIPLSSSISSEQLVSIHNSTPASIYTINNNAQTLWTSLLNPTNPLNITLQITDLPTGQLAEAQITKFDLQGRPKVGTIILDHDANGIGWYIDPTPFDHSEFTQPLTDTTFRATTTSPAAGKYDLLTTILHEMGHIAGIISGHNSFDRHIQTILRGRQL